jgi:hypothetical protein
MDESENNIEQNDKPQRVFALVADGEVFHKWYIEENYSNAYMAALIYGLQSNPTVIDITDKNHEEISFGWIQDGDSFTPPALEE